MSKVDIKIYLKCVLKCFIFILRSLLNITFECFAVQIEKSDIYFKIGGKYGQER